MLSSNLRRLQSRTAYYIWVGVFCFIVIGVVGGLYWATIQTDYNWRWFRVPRYFVYEEELEFRAEIEGDVKAIVHDGRQGIAYVLSQKAIDLFAVFVYHDTHSESLQGAVSFTHEPPASSLDRLPGFALQFPLPQSKAV